MDIMSAGQFQSVVVMSTSSDELPRVIRSNWPKALIIGRLFRGGPDLPKPEDAVRDWRGYISLTRGKVDLWQVDNEPDENYPNVTPGDFTAWWVQVVTFLRTEFPGERWGFPMPSVQGEPSWEYALRCESGIEAADWIAERGYWNNPEGFDSSYWAGRYFLTHARWPDKIVHLCEYGNSDPGLDPMEKAYQYRRFLRELPPYISSANVFLMAGAPDWDAKGFGVTQEMARIILGQGIRQPSPGKSSESAYSDSHDGNDGGVTLNDGDRNRLWADYMQFPAFERFRADHPELGDALEPGERDYGGYRVKFFAGGVIGCKVGDWANIQIWTSKESLPSPL